VHRFVRGKPGLNEGVADRPRGGEEILETCPWKSFPRGEAPGSFGEERSEVQAARRVMVMAGGWRSDCATTQ